jgi:uncharacterized protein
METLSLARARRLAIRSQHLAGPAPAAGPDGMRQVLRALRVLQLDPVNVVARNHLLVLWSRLGGFDVAGMEALRWRDRWLEEYWAHAASLVLAEDFPVHAMMMREYPGGPAGEPAKAAWLAANDEFRRYIVTMLGESGPLRMEALEDRAAVGWVSTGWTHGRNVERMLDILWKQGVIRVASRDGLLRLWELAPWDPRLDPLPREEAVALAARHALGALGVARERDIVRHFTCGRYPGLDLASCGFARKVRVEGGDEDWWMLDEAQALLEEEWAPRTTLLSPFDNLICDRERTLRLFGFAYRNEMYVRKSKRQYGHYTMPVLHGDVMIGRVAVRADRERGVLVVDGWFPEEGWTGGAVARRARGEVAVAVDSLAAFAGASQAEHPAGGYC